MSVVILFLQIRLSVRFTISTFIFMKEIINIERDRIKWVVEDFRELNAGSLYKILRLRSEVFVVEQNCVYQDIDTKDQKAIHLTGSLDGSLVAYCRLFRPGDYFEEASIGRVVTSPRYRNRGVGNILLEKAIGELESRLGETPITISAQLYLKQFYEKYGFVQISEMYLEDDISHIRMRRG